MKNLKYILLFIFSIGILNSCIDNDTDLDLNGDVVNLAGFVKNVTAIAAIADDSESDFLFKMGLTGPTSMNVTNDVTVTVAVNDSSTAIEGTHFRIDNKTITLTAANNHFENLMVTMITLNIVTPLAKSPVLILDVITATGDGDVINNGKQIAITFNYACPSFLEGDYDVVTTRMDGGLRYWTEHITEIGIGEYLTEYVGTWDPPLNPDYGMVFTDVCDVINVPLQGLADMYSNDVWSHTEGNVDRATGIVTIIYTIEFGSGNQTYSSVYTPVP